MIEVKWVHKETPSQFYTERPMPSGLGTIEEQFIPVVPLSALREVVEGLVQINTEMHLIKQNNQGGYVGDKEACRRAASIAQRLLASLGEQ